MITMAFKDVWLPPAPTADRLPDRAEDGSLCWVDDEERIYLRENGQWSPGPRKGKEKAA